MSLKPTYRGIHVLSTAVPLLKGGAKGCGLIWASFSNHTKFLLEAQLLPVMVLEITKHGSYLVKT